LDSPFEFDAPVERPAVRGGPSPHFGANLMHFLAVEHVAWPYGAHGPTTWGSQRWASTDGRGAGVPPAGTGREDLGVAEAVHVPAEGRDGDKGAAQPEASASLCSRRDLLLSLRYQAGRRSAIGRVLKVDTVDVA
jgi:hypothetical protein